jgi:hypothetical protein
MIVKARQEGFIITSYKKIKFSLVISLKVPNFVVISPFKLNILEICHFNSEKIQKDIIGSYHIDNNLKINSLKSLWR